VSSQQRLDLGINAGPRVGPKLPVPDEMPTVHIDDVRATAVRVSITSSRGRARPRGVAGAVILTSVGEGPPTLDTFRFQTTTSRWQEEIVFPTDLPTGTQVWVTACWVNPRLERGMWSQPVSVRLPGALVGLPRLVLTAA
jgi:hypothetical protein